MTKEEKELYSQKEAVAVCAMFAFGGIELLEINDEYAVARYMDRLHRVKVRYDANEPYIIIDSMRVFISDFQRV